MPEPITPPKTDQTPTPETPQAPAPAEATPAAPAAPAAPDSKPIETGADDPVLKVLFADINLEPKVDPKPIAAVTEPKPEAHPAAKATEPPKEPVPTPALVKAEVVKKPKTDLNDLVDARVRAALEENRAKQTLPSSTPPPEPKKPESEDLTGWTPEEIDALELAKYAEKDPNYAGQADKVRTFHKLLPEYLAKAKAEDPDRTLDENDKEYQDWLAKNQPKYRPGDARRLERQRIEEETAARVEAKMAARFAETERKLHLQETQPKVERQMREFNKTTLEAWEDPNEGGSEDLARITKRVKEVGIEAATKEAPQQVRAAVETFEVGARIAQEYLALQHRVTNYDEKNVAHKWLVGFLDKQSQIFQQQPEKNRVRDGKTFMPFLQYHTTPEAERKNAWTFSDQHVLGMIGVQSKRDAAAKVAQIEQELTAAGYVRQPIKKDGEAKPTQPTPTPEPVKSVVVSAAPGPGATSSGSKSTGSSAVSDLELKLLGLK